jgi:hypothetical protein
MLDVQMARPSSGLHRNRQCPSPWAFPKILATYKERRKIEGIFPPQTHFFNHYYSRLFFQLPGLRL